MVEVFKTNVEKPEQTQWLINKMIHYFPNGKINFDLEDRDRILRVESDCISNEIIIKLLVENGFKAEVLP